jgi:enoyl-CoA hydratase/carnithine racemase
MTGRMIDVEEAHRLGLVNRVVEPARLLEASFELGGEIQDLGPLAVSGAKRLVDQGLDLPLAEGLDREHAEMTRLFDTRDAKEGISAFKDKRPPRFTGE